MPQHLGGEQGKGTGRGVGVRGGRGGHSVQPGWNRSLTGPLAGNRREKHVCLCDLVTLCEC